MAVKRIDLNRNSDGTLTMRVGRQVEHIDARFKSKSEIYEAVKWCAISKGIYLSQIDLTELIQKVSVA